MRFPQFRFNFPTLLILTVIVTLYMAHSCVALVVWQPEKTFFSPAKLPSSALGGPVAVDGTMIVAGAAHNTSETKLERFNIAFVYKQDGAQWKPQATLQGNGFRDDIAIYASEIKIFGDTIALGVLEGAVEFSVTIPYKRFVYIFERQGSTWIKQAKIASPHSEGAESFATSVALNGNTLVVDDYGGFSIFSRNSTTGEWSYQTKLTLPKQQDDFG